MAFNWTCPYCNKPQTVTSYNESDGSFCFNTVMSTSGYLGMTGRCIICSNPDCLAPSVSVRVIQVTKNSAGNLYIQKPLSILHEQRLLPNSMAKPQPDYIPQALRDDYREACLIRDLSPKASATLSRRCLQGMIRNFSGVEGKTLFAEIEALRSLVKEGKAPLGVSIDSVEAIDHVRSVGNIGAHMEKDIDHIVPVEPEEAQILIDLIESLFEEWYIARETRARRFSGVKALAESKKALISDLKSLQIEAPE